MNSTEIRKELYKQKPLAKFVYVRNKIAVYASDITVENTDKTIVFEIPIDDMGDATFTDMMDAKLLSRWLIEVQL